MSNVRRWYIYLVCAISLQAVAWAVIFLLRNLLTMSGDLLLTSIAMQSAVIVVGLPMYLVHWLWAQRLAEKDLEERGSVLRRLYLYGMLAAFLASFLSNAFGLIMYLFASLKPVAESTYNAYTSSRNAIGLRELVAMVVLAVLFFYHYRLLQGDARTVPESGGIAVVRRLYVYGFSAAGLVLTSLALIHLLRWLMVAIVGTMTILMESNFLLNAEIARILIGLSVWLVFWLWAGRLFEGRNEEERQSALRKFYLYSAIFISALIAITNLTIILAGAFRRLMDLPSQGSIFTPLPIIIAAAMVWAYHALVLRQDAALVPIARQQAGLRRLYQYLIAGVGLAALLIGLSGEISVLLRSTQEAFSLVLKDQLAYFSAALIAGLPVWILPWRQVQYRAEVDSPEGKEERGSLVRRIYLYFFLFVATLAVLSSSVYIVYRLLSLLLGIKSASYLTSDLGQAISYTLIGVGVWLYHGLILRKDGHMNRFEQEERLAEWKVVVVDFAGGSFGSAVLTGISQAVPGLAPQLIQLPEAGEQSTTVTLTLSEQLAQANVIVGPWTIAVSGGAAGKVSNQLALAVLHSPARKLLVPTPEEGWEWAAVDCRDLEKLVQQTVHAFKQIAAGDEVKPIRPLGFGASVGIFLGALLLIILLAIPIIFYFSY